MSDGGSPSSRKTRIFGKGGLTSRGDSFALQKGGGKQASDGGINCDRDVPLVEKKKKKKKVRAEGGKAYGAPGIYFCRSFAQRGEERAWWGGRGRGMKHQPKTPLQNRVGRGGGVRVHPGGGERVWDGPNISEEKGKRGNYPSRERESKSPSTSAKKKGGRTILMSGENIVYSVKGEEKGEGERRGALDPQASGEGGGGRGDRFSPRRGE